MFRRIGSKQHLLCHPSCRCQHRKLRHSDSPQDFPCVERDSKTFYSSLIACKSQGAKRASSSAECVGIHILDDDTLIEILARLPIEVVPIMKCVCKQWCHLIKSDSFGNAHFRKSKNGVVGTFLQGMWWCRCCKDVIDYESVDFLGIDKEGRYVVKKNMLDFLPEKVAVAASCNGLVICRSLFQRNKDHDNVAPMTTKNPLDAELLIYVCNPLTKEFRVLKPNLTNKDRCALGLAFNLSEPFSSCFEVLVVQVLQKATESFCYVFKIFSSITNTWRVCKDKCHYSHKLLFQHHAFVNGVFYWLASGHSILAFDLEKEKSHIIKLPGPVLMTQGAFGMCIGVSEDNIHYVTLTLNEFMVWILTGDYLNPLWQLKYFRHVSGGSKLVDSKEWDGKLCPMPDSYNSPHTLINPLGFKDDVVFFDWQYYFEGYNIKTGDIEELSSFLNMEATSWNTPIIVSYSRSLLPVLQ